MNEPRTIQISAWRRQVAGPRAPYDREAGAAWGGAPPPALDGEPGFMWAQRVDLRAIDDDAVGWGLVVADNPTLSSQDRWDGSDLPEDLKELLRFRRGVLLRARGDAVFRAEAPSTPLSLEHSRFGKLPHAVPRYLLICGAPSQLSWRLQYRLSTRRFVGRLDLPPDARRRYARAVMSGFAGSAANTRHAVLWSVTTGSDDVTDRMHDTLARPLAEQLGADPDLLLDAKNGEVTEAVLRSAVAKRQPALVVTTSHGYTESAGGLLANRLGLPVDSAGEALAIDLLLDEWQPDGCIWYSHGCCSAGSDDRSLFADLVPSWPSLVPIFNDLAGVGATSGALPRILLSADRPARCVIGHVEPTFDWTLGGAGADRLTQDFEGAFYDELYSFGPVGLAMTSWTSGALAHLANSALALGEFRRTQSEESRARMVVERLRGLDRLSLVIFGDPAVALAPSGGGV